MIFDLELAICDFVNDSGRNGFVNFVEAISSQLKGLN